MFAHFFLCDGVFVSKALIPAVILRQERRQRLRACHARQDPTQMSQVGQVYVELKQNIPLFKAVSAFFTVRISAYVSNLPNQLDFNQFHFIPVSTPACSTAR